MKEKIKLIEILKLHHHDFLTKKGCDKFLEPFDIEFNLEKVKANPHDIKGLSLWDKQGNDIDEAEGLSGLDISSMIASKLKIEVPNFFGRGFQHQSNCEAIIEKLKEKK